MWHPLPTDAAQKMLNGYIRLEKPDFLGCPQCLPISREPIS